MSKPKLQIIVLFQNLGENQAYFARSPAPPLSGALVAGLTPPIVEVELLHDDEFVDLLVKARCGMAFIGLESLNEPSLSSVHKKQNKVEEYKELFEKLKKRGILTFTGLMLALDEDTPSYCKSMPEKLDEIDPSSILLSISIPIPGTSFHKQVESEGRIFDRDLSHYEGDHLVFTPKRVSPNEKKVICFILGHIFFLPVGNSQQH